MYAQSLRAAGQRSDSVTDLLEDHEIRRTMAAIDTYINRYLDTDVGHPQVLYDAAHHLIRAGGKRLRSLITVLTCELVGGNAEKALPVALAAELLKTASLIHDDIIDNEKARRGVPAVHRVSGVKMAIIAGDLLISQAVRILGEQGNPELLAIMGGSGARMCEGEAADMSVSPDRPEAFEKKHYLELIEKKTVSFLEESAKVGAVVGGATASQKRALAEYARALGFAFQLRDDLLDVDSRTRTRTGRARSSLELDHGNYALIEALDMLSKEERAICLTSLAEGRTGPALRAIKATKAAERVQQTARDYVEQAKRALSQQPREYARLLEKLADFALVREQ